MAKDYYQTLGVSRSATPEQLKAAYRKLAMEHHPDRGGGKDAETKFKEINEAYQVLSDQKKREQYDRFGSTFSGAGPPPGPGGMPTDFDGFEFNFGSGGLGDIFENLFSQAFSTVQAQIEISPVQAVLGDTLHLSLGGDEINLTIPPGTQVGTQFMLRGKGNQTRRGRGDLILQTVIKIPSKLSREERRLWEELKKLQK